MKPREVFLSHASADRRTAERIVAELRRCGIKVWYSRTNLRGAQAWHDEIGKALGRCDWLVVILTPAAVRSEWVRREVTYALIQKRYRERIVPLLVKPCRHRRLSWTLAGLQMVSFRRSFRVGVADLLKVWSEEG
jgi:TIR domain